MRCFLCHTGCAGFDRWGAPWIGRRVVCGGSWNNNQDHARAAYRNNNDPGNRNNNLGFRVVRRPTSSVTLFGRVRFRLAVAGLFTDPAKTGFRN